LSVQLKDLRTLAAALQAQGHRSAM